MMQASTLPSITIVDYGVGNLASVGNMIRRAGAQAVFARSADEVAQAERLILPGVGAFDACRRALDLVPGLEGALRHAVARQIPLLGICVGMQLLATASDEGVLPGLDLIPGRVRRFDVQHIDARLRVPHMAWSSVAPCNRATLFQGELSELNRFYFVHSYYYDCADQSDVAGTAVHGHAFCAAVERAGIYGVQFHPEKSHRFGMALFKTFAALAPGGNHG